MLFLHMVMTIHSMLRTHPEVDLNNVKCNTSKSRLARLQAYCMHLGPGTWETRLLYWFGRHFADTHMYTPMLPDLTASYLIVHRTVLIADLDVDSGLRSLIFVFIPGCSRFVHRAPACP